MNRIGGHSILMVRLGEAHLQALRRADAERCAREAVSLARDYTERGHEAYAFRLLGELGLNDPPDLEDSELFFHQGIARAAAQTLGFPVDPVADGDVDTFILVVALLVGHVGDQFLVDTVPCIGQVDGVHG